MSNWNNGFLNIRKMEFVYSCYLESSDVCDFHIWLKRHTSFSEYQTKRLCKFQHSERAINICHAHAWD